MVAVSTVEALHGAGCAHVNAPARRTGSDDSKGPARSRLAPWLSRGRSAGGKVGARIEGRARRSGIEPARLAATGLAVAAGLGVVALVVSDFLVLFEVRTITAVVPGGRVTGGANHAYAMLIVGLVAAPMAFGALAGGSRPAMIALAVLAAVAVGIALIKDLPVATGPSTLKQAQAYQSTNAVPQAGFFVETLGAALLLVAGGGTLMLWGGRSSRADRPRSRPRSPEGTPSPSPGD